MRTAIISDIHSNFEALTTAVDVIDQHGIDEIVCLGDIVGYGANPNECLELVRRRCHIVLMGNHEEAVINRMKAENFTSNARAAIDWTRNRITEENLTYLRTLSLVHQSQDAVFVHASPCNPGEWSYIFEEESAARTFDCFSEPLCFVGHTHIPAIFSLNGYESRITKEERHLVNVGSVGQPRDRNARLSFGIFDAETWTYENIRTSYDVERAAQKIIHSDLPARLGQRLLLGV